ncbi:hypothetical protein M758_UG037000 [Ceratodon purpureus]|nr:hypothetical protein M758_UG037000 [Ceratodon purpureus]
MALPLGHVKNAALAVMKRVHPVTLVYHLRFPFLLVKRPSSSQCVQVDSQNALRSESAEATSRVVREDGSWNRDIAWDLVASYQDLPPQNKESYHPIVEETWDSEDNPILLLALSRTNSVITLT